MTDKKYDNILAAISLIFVPFVFFFGIFAWKHPDIDLMIAGRKLYYISIASVMYMMSFVTFIMARAKWLKILSSTVVSLFAVNLYEEVVIGAAPWSGFSYGLIIVVALNYFVLYIIIEKLKK